MQTITWKHPCFFCKRPIQRGKPTLTFATDRPELLGICHATCGATKYRYGYFQTCPPDFLSEERVSFLVQLYYTLYSLPGGEQPNHELRMCLAEFLHDYPGSITNALASLKKFLDRYKQRSRVWLYHGDLETDFLRTLGQIQKAAREELVGIEMDFRKS